MTSDIDTLAATVRDHERFMWGDDAALAALVEHARTLERERDDLAVKLVVSSAGGIHALQDRARAAGARADRYEKALAEKPNQPMLNAARRLVMAEDDASRNAALGDLVNAMAARAALAAECDGSSNCPAQVHIHGCFRDLAGEDA